MIIRTLAVKMTIRNGFFLAYSIIKKLNVIRFVNSYGLKK